MVVVCQMAGCSYRDEMDVADGATSPVPVEFSIPSTKGIINGLDDLVNNSSVFGMFAIDKSLYGDADGDLTAADGLNLRNALCRYVAPTASEPASLKLGYQSENRILYYPMNSDVSYNFYTYHKWTSSVVTADDGTESQALQTVSEMVSSKRQIKVIMDVAGVDDVLYSESVAPPAVDADGESLDGYNAAYIRETGNVPAFRMRHPVAGVRCKVALHPESRMTVAKMDRLRLNSMSFTNGAKSLPVQAALCIVDLDNPENNGTFVEVMKTAASKAWKTANAGTGNLNMSLLDDTDGDGVTSCMIEPELVGGEHFIMPQDDHLELTLTFQHQRVNATGGIVGNWPAMTRTVVLDPSDYGAADGGYKAGQIYSYKILVKYVNDVLPYNPNNDSVELTVVADI